jgi:prepilin-type N-terminal cleavage/methylation domain-containing protein
MVDSRWRQTGGRTEVATVALPEAGPSSLVRAQAPRQPAFTLIEMVVVIAVLIILAALVLPNLADTKSQSMSTTTSASLTAVRDAITGSAAGPGFYADMGQLPVTLKDLFVAPTWATPAMQQFNPQTGRGWRGPYVTLSLTLSYTVDASGKSGFTNVYGNNGDPAPADAWLRPLVLQAPGTTAAEQKTYARLVSAGPDGIIQTPANVDYPAPANRGDDLVQFLYRPDVQVSP